MAFETSFKFLRGVKKNNNREWFLKNKDLYISAKQEFENFIDNVIKEISTFDNSVSELKAKDCIYRQYRDVRFSKDKTPYKVHMGAYINSEGKKINTPGYYFHLEPGGKSIFGGGFWEPEKDLLKKVRQEIDYNLEEWESIITEKTFKNSYPQGLSKENSLLNQPAGYDKDNPAIEYLKLKSFIVSHNFSDEQIMSNNLLKEVKKHAKALKPAIDFLKKSLH
ncbi:MAG: DUF2461 domain-containing protein [Bacteroidetes bacterium]|nr:DUF2461 domain-containing protein [Bacteroidota bacterium]